MSTRTLSVRARVGARPEPPFDLLYDPLVDDVVRGGPIARERFAVRWSDADAVRALAEAKRAPLDPALARELAELHRRLGAAPASLAALDRLARGEAVCAVSGQQPAPLGGPLYTLHKTAGTVGLARAVEARTGMPCVPLFWMHGEDSDFAEIHAVTVGDSTLALHDLALPESADGEGRLVGGIPLEPVRTLIEQALAHWSGLRGHEEVARLARDTLARGRDLGEVMSALMLALFGDAGLIVVDPRLPAFRALARPVIDRYLVRADEVTAAVRRAGEALESRLGRQPLADPALESFVFAIEDGARHKISVEEARARAADRPLSPSVALRPAVQDAAFPTVAMACGAGELAYLAQLREVFEGVEVRAACPVPRFGATWLAPAAVALLEEAEAEPFALVSGADAVLRLLAERRVPAEARADLERAHRAALEGLDRYAGSAGAVDASLPQMVQSARGKVDYQFARLTEGLVGKVRHRLERQHPEWLRVRYHLLPGDRLQERRLVSLEPVAYRGAGVAGELCDLADEAARRVAEGVHEHHLLELG